MNEPKTEAGRRAIEPPFNYVLDIILAIEAEAAASPVLDAERMTHAWAILTAETNPDRWEPDRYNAAAFVTALLDKYAALAPSPDPGFKLSDYDPDEGVGGK